MIKINAVLLLIICLNVIVSQAQTVIPAVPSPVQYTWHEQERIMFIHFGMATWQHKEYDDGNFDLSRVNPGNIDTGEWCEVAKSWGAREIIFVAKHAGGFCWWPTLTTEYCVRNIPWKNGKGDLLADVANSCRKAGLNLGIYLYPGDAQFGAGNGGITTDPSKQEAYNKIYRQQLTEVLVNYGHITEVWFDGSCNIEVGDILEKFSLDAVIFQGPLASIRWPGTESGKLAYPVWNTVSSTALKSGVSTQQNDDPDGDAWAPLEADIPLYNHYWFWAPDNERKRKSKEELMEIYYKSAGYGGVLLINAAPDTNGTIPAGDQELFRWFGKELENRFGTPLGEIRNAEGDTAVISFMHPVRVNHTMLMEDYRYGHRIREYRVEGYSAGAWKELAAGTSVGRKKIDVFPSVSVTSLRVIVTRQKGTPLIRSFSTFNVPGYDGF